MYGKSLKLFHPWRGIAAVVLVAAGAAVAITYGVMATLVMKD